jgi:amino acid transporter
MAIWSVLNFFDIEKVGGLNGVAAFCQFGTLFLITIGVPVCAAKTASASFVFTQFYDFTANNAPDALLGRSPFSASYVTAVGVTTALFTFAGYEVPWFGHCG